jgi:hypothetical protein
MGLVTAPSRSFWPENIAWFLRVGLWRNLAKTEKGNSGVTFLVWQLLACSLSLRA